MKPFRVSRWIALSAALSLLAATPGGSEREAIAHAEQTAQEAQAKKDHAAFHRALLELDRLKPGDPGVQKRLAYAETLLGQPEVAFRRLEQVAAMHMTFHDLAAAGFAPLRQLPSYPDLEKRFKANGVPISHATVARTLDQADLIAEDLAYDPGSGAFFVSSVRHRKIQILPAHGPQRDWVTEGRDGVWSILALAVDTKRHLLWASTAAMNEATVPKGEAGRSALLAYDLTTGALHARYDLPGGGEHVLGDMTLGPSGDVFISESVSGAVYVLRHTSKALEAVVPPGTFLSPQNPALSPDGKRLFVADYDHGIAVVDLTTRAISWLSHPTDLAVNGIDGMYLVGDAIWAVQNGTTPNRVARLQLDASLSRIVSWELIESGSGQLGSPTHGVVVGQDFYFIGRSGWEHIGDDGALNKGERFEAPLILRAPLRRPAAG